MALLRGEAGSDWSEDPGHGDCLPKKELTDRIQWNKVLRGGLVERTASSTAATTSPHRRQGAERPEAKRIPEGSSTTSSAIRRRKEHLVYEDR